MHHNFLKKRTFAVLICCLATISFADQSLEQRCQKLRKEMFNKILQDMHKNFKNEEKTRVTKKLEQATPEQLLEASRDFIAFIFSLKLTQLFLSKKEKSEISENALQECLKKYPRRKKECNLYQKLTEFTQSNNSDTCMKIILETSLFDDVLANTVEQIEKGKTQ